MGLIGLVVLGVLATQRALLTSQRAHDAHTHTVRGSFALFLQPAILLCFFYFVVQTTASIGLQTFLPSALNAGLDVPLALATSAVTAYLLGGAAGIVAGGFLAVRTTRHDRVAGTGLVRGCGADRAGRDRARCRRRCCAAVRRRSASCSARPGPRATSSCATRRPRARRVASTASSIRASTSAPCSARCGSASCSTTGSRARCSSSSPRCSWSRSAPWCSVRRAVVARA